MAYVVNFFAVVGIAYVLRGTWCWGRAGWGLGIGRAGGIERGLDVLTSLGLGGVGEGSATDAGSWVLFCSPARWARQSVVRSVASNGTGGRTDVQCCVEVRVRGERQTPFLHIEKFFCFFFLDRCTKTRFF